MTLSDLLGVTKKRPMFASEPRTVLGLALSLS
jgi:hypothetical protein